MKKEEVIEEYEKLLKKFQDNVHCDHFGGEDISIETTSEILRKYFNLDENEILESRMKICNY